MKSGRRRTEIMLCVMHALPSRSPGLWGGVRSVAKQEGRTRRLSRNLGIFFEVMGRHEKPWSVPYYSSLAHLSSQAIVALYSQRMRIEQSFRDAKNERGGLGLSTSRSRSGKRFEMLLLIGHLAAWVMRLIGECAQQAQMQLQFQSVARLDHKEISVMTLARRVIDAGSTWLHQLRISEAIPLLQQQALRACYVYQT